MNYGPLIVMRFLKDLKEDFIYKQLQELKKLTVNNSKHRKMIKVNFKPSKIV
jgi:hypothetical protein